MRSLYVRLTCVESQPVQVFALLPKYANAPYGFGALTPVGLMCDSVQPDDWVLLTPHGVDQPRMVELRTRFAPAPCTEFVAFGTAFALTVCTA